MRKLLLLCILLLTLTTQQLNAETIGIIDDSALSSTNEAGTYPVVISHRTSDGKEYETTIYVTIYRRNTQENKEAKEAIDAQDATIQKGYFEELTDLELLKVINARAWSTVNGDPIPITTVERKLVNDDLLIYEVTIATAKGTKTTVKVIERDEAFMSNNMEYASQSLNLFSSTPTFYWHLELLALLMLASPVVLLLFNYWREQKMVKHVNELLYRQAKITRPRH